LKEKKEKKITKYRVEEFIKIQARILRNFIPKPKFIINYDSNKIDC
jgi:hypothetical protein